MNNIKKKELREFSFVFGIGLPIFIGYVIPLIWGHPFREWTLVVGIIIIIIGMFKPSLLSYPYKSWIRLGNILGWINSRIIFGLVFIFILQPIAFLMKLSGYDPLRKKSKDVISYREKRINHKIDLKRIF